MKHGLKQVTYATRLLAPSLILNIGIGYLVSPFFAILSAAFTVAPVAVGYPALKAWQRMERHHPEHAQRVKESRVGQFYRASAPLTLIAVYRAKREIKAGRVPVNPPSFAFHRSAAALLGVAVVAGVATFFSQTAWLIAAVTAPAIPMLLDSGVEQARRIESLGAYQPTRATASKTRSQRETGAPDRDASPGHQLRAERTVVVRRALSEATGLRQPASRDTGIDLL